jgi:hypothetical protein
MQRHRVDWWCGSVAVAVGLLLARQPVLSRIQGLSVVGSYPRSVSASELWTCGLFRFPLRHLQHARLAIGVYPGDLELR